MPFVTSDQIRGILHLHFTPKTALAKPYKTMLRIFYKTYDSSSYEMDIPIMIDGATLDLTEVTQ